MWTNGAKKTIALSKSPEATNTMLFVSDESPLVLYKHSLGSVKSPVISTSYATKANKHRQDSDAYSWQLTGYSSDRNKMPTDSNDCSFLSDNNVLNAARFSGNAGKHSMKTNKHWLKEHRFLRKTSNMLFVTGRHSLHMTIICGVRNSR